MDLDVLLGFGDLLLLLLADETAVSGELFIGDLFGEFDGLLVGLAAVGCEILRLFDLGAEVLGELGVLLRLFKEYCWFWFEAFRSSF